MKLQAKGRLSEPAVCNTDTERLQKRNSRAVTLPTTQKSVNWLDVVDDTAQVESFVQIEL